MYSYSGIGSIERTLKKNTSGENPVSWRAGKCEGGEGGRNRDQNKRSLGVFI